MADSRKFEEIFDEYSFTSRAEKSIKEYSNWLLGISLGLAAVVISLSKNYHGYIYYTISALVIVFFGVLYNGHLKYQLMNRDIQLNTKFGELKKIKILRSTKKSENIPVEKDVEQMERWNAIFQEYTTESNRIATIGKRLNWATYLTGLNVFATGLYVFLTLIDAS